MEISAVSKETANASPTKNFFIEMLVVDVPLDVAINDLIDNCVDGAIRTSDGSESFDKYWVKIKLDEKEFKIWDNCGGISIERARDYAFRFGRPIGAGELKRSIGTYGVGMKRSLFKLGNQFTIDSTTKNSHFKIAVDVNEWRKKEDDWKDWSFSMTEVDREKHENEIGTRINVTQLNDGVSQDFAQSGWINELIDSVRAKQGEHISKGLEITINEFPLTSEPITLEYLSKKIMPAHRRLPLKSATGSRVNIRILAGTDESSPPDAGWYVYCNGRLVLRADQTAATGWSNLSEPVMPKYHNQFAKFRGYVFFESDYASTLPWNTSKTGIDEGSEIYRRVKLEMVEMMRPVIDFLNELDKENEYPVNQRPLHNLVEKASHVGVTSLRIRKDFGYAARKKARPKDEIPIRYKRPTRKVERAMKVLGVGTPGEVGEKTFDAFYKEACEE